MFSSVPCPNLLERSRSNINVLSPFFKEHIHYPSLSASTFEPLFPSKQDSDSIQDHYHKRNPQVRHVTPLFKVVALDVNDDIVNMEAVDTTERLTQLRQLMRRHKVDIYSM